MSQHTPATRRPTANRQRLPRGRSNLIALEVALDLASSLHQLQLPRGLGHLRDHLIRAADNTALRLAEASGRTLGHRHQHLEAAYAECQEVQCDLALLGNRGITVLPATFHQAHRLGGLIYGLLRADLRRRRP